MTKVVVYLASPGMMVASIFISDTQLISDRWSDYTRAFEFETELTGAAAAEEAFDLTNNPDRQEEREEKYGRGRSVSSGDVAEVDGVRWACMSMGWKQMD